MKTKLFTLFLAIMATSSLWANIFKCGDLYYQTLTSTPYTVRVVRQEDGANNYSGITAITIPETVEYNDTTYSVVEICFSAFAHCSSLMSVSIPNSVTDIGIDAFFESGIYNNASNWEDGALYVDNCLVGIKNELDYNYRSSFTVRENTRLIGGVRFIVYWSNLKEIAMPNSVKYISEDAFVGLRRLTSITLSENLLRIGEGAFASCEALESITIPNSVTHIGESTFLRCTSLKSITIPNSVTHLGRIAFKNCSALTSVILPNAFTDIGESTFAGCTSLASITLPENLLTVGSEAFAGCTSLTSITFPENVLSIGQYAFKGCTSLSSITFPEKLLTVGSGAFAGCTSLESITIPKSVTYIGGGAFAETPWYDNQPDGVLYINNVLYQYKGSMPPNTSIDIKDGTVLISGDAFLFFNSLISITIPESLAKMQNRAFAYCTNLKSVTCKAIKTPQIYEYTFMKVPLSESILYVPIESLNDYKTSEYWKEFGTILPIEETAVENVEASNSPSMKKMLQNGQVVILHNDKSYDVMGHEIE